MAILARGMHTEGRLRDKLRRAGHAQADIDAAVVAMTRLGYLDDSRFAAAKARTEADRRNRGPGGAYGVLVRSGVPKPLARHASQEAYADVDTAAAARALVANKSASLARLDRDGARRRLTGMLQRRGFSATDIRAAVDDAVGHLPRPTLRKHPAPGPDP